MYHQKCDVANAPVHLQMVLETNIALCRQLMG
jgi:hypothetical protein